MKGETNSFTGRQRDRKTKFGVKVSDLLARIFITMGGAGTILAVSTVFVFLVYVALPLFFPAKIDSPQINELPWAQSDNELIHLAIDEYRTMGWAFFSDGSIIVFRCDTGERLFDVLQPFEQRKLTAYNFNTDSDDVYFGFEDGYIQLAEMGVNVDFLSDNQVPEDIRKMPLNEIRVHSDGVYVQPRPNQFRFHRFTVSLKSPIKLSEHPIDLIGHTLTASGQFVVAHTGGKLSISSVREIRNFLTGVATPQLRKAEFEYKKHPQGFAPKYLMVSKLGNLAYLAWEDGKLMRFDTRNLNSIRLAETIYLTESEGATLSSLCFLIGKTTLVSGDSEGNIKTWFCVPDEYKPDLVSIKQTHNLSNEGVAITALSGSARSRLLAAGMADGSVKLFYVTSNRSLAQAAISDNVDSPKIEAVALGARENFVFAVNSNSIAGWNVHLSHPAINLQSLFGKVWYEGYAEPEYIWQSSAGVDDFEPKYSLTPLIFGTIKATFYSMLFGLPIALLAVFEDAFNTSLIIFSHFGIVFSIPVIVAVFIRKMPRWTALAAMPVCLVTTLFIEFAVPQLAENSNSNLLNHIAANLFQYKVFGALVANFTVIGLARLSYRYDARKEEQTDKFFAMLNSPVNIDNKQPLFVPNLAAYRLVGWSLLFFAAVIALISALPAVEDARKINLAGVLVMLIAFAVIHWLTSPKYSPIKLVRLQSKQGIRGASKIN